MRTVMKEYFKNRKNQIITAVFIITTVIACAPLISKYCLNGHDLEYHLLRIDSLKEGIKAGKPFLKVNMLFFGGAGYASSMFYPDFLLYIPALLRTVGVSINASYHIFVGICIILTYLSAYFCIKSMTHSSFGGMIAAVTLTLCQYHLDDIYVRGAVGEYTAFIFVPVIIYGIFNIIYEEMDKPQLFILGYTGVLLCHTSTFVMCTVFGLAVILICFRKTIADKRVFIRLIISTLITLLLTCFYWLPMLEQFLHTRFYVSTPWMQPKDEAVSFVNLFGPVFPGLGAICVLLLIPRIFIKKKSDDKEMEEITGYADLLIIAGFVFTLIASDLIPWDRIGRYLGFIQFPWRFLIMGSCLFSLAAGLIFGRIAGRDEAFKLWLFEKDKDFSYFNTGAFVLVGVLVLNGVSAFSAYRSGLQGYYDYSDDYYSYKPYTANVIAGEWLPEAVTDKESLVDDSERMRADNGQAVDFARIKNRIEADLGEGYEYIDVPFVYYLGYTASVTDESGTTYDLKVNGEGNNGMCRVYTDGRTGRLSVDYKGTLLMHISALISIITAVISIAVSVIWKRKGRA